MTVKDLLKVLNMQVKYRIVDRNTKIEIFNNFNHKALSREEIKEMKDRTIYMIFNDMTEDNILDIRVF